MGIERVSTIISAAVKNGSRAAKPLTRLHKKGITDLEKAKRFCANSKLTRRNNVEVFEKELIEHAKSASEYVNPFYKISLPTNGFNEYKAKLIKEYSKLGETNIANNISKANNIDEIEKILNNSYINSSFQLQESINRGLYRDGIVHRINKVNEAFMNGDVQKGTNLLTSSRKTWTLAKEQTIYKARQRYENLAIAREKALHVASTNPQVVAIENILKQKYGCQFVSLKDNEVVAKRVLKAFEVAQKNGAPLPKNVMISNSMTPNLGGENLGNTIFLNRHIGANTSGFSSTQADYHVVLHEILHSSHPSLTSFMQAKIPKKLLDVKNTVSQYSASSNTAETFTELHTKKLINGLNPKEQQLFDHLNVFG